MIPRQSSTSSSDSQPKRSRRKSRNSKPNRNRRLTMEGLERRQLLAANPIGPIGNIDEFDGPRNVGSVTAFQYREQESANETNENDSRFNAEFIQLGNLPGQRNTIDVTGTLSFQIGPFGGFTTDQDFYSFDLQAGDILDIAGLGAISTFDVYTPDGALWLGQDGPLPNVVVPNFYPINSPLQTQGNVLLAQVAPFTGRYTIGVSTENILSNYTLGLRTYRPVTESLPIGQAQVVFLDFDGATLTQDDFNLGLANPGVFSGGRFRIPPIAQTLDQAGLVVANQLQYDAVARRIVDTVTAQLNDVGNYTGNGSYRLTGTPGEYGVTILNSLDHPNAEFELQANGVPHTRVLFGSVAAFPGIVGAGGLLGLAQTIDVGNFDLDETVLVFVDNEVDAAAGVPRSSALSEFDVVGLEIGATTTHELGHVFGLYHTDGGNLTPSLIDGGGALNDENGLGVGPDGILGTMDDIIPRFRTDFVDPGGAVTFGTLYSGESLAHVLSTGTQGGGLTGRVFEDLNANGNGTGDPGLAGVRVFLDINRNGVLDPSEPSTLTDANGSYSLAAAPNSPSNPTYTVVAQSPPITSSTRTVSVGANGVLSNSGNAASNPIAAGSTVFVDFNNNGTRDFNEPSDVVDADGIYLLTNVTPGTYLLGIQSPGNFQLTTPGSQTIAITGSTVSGPTFGFTQINPDVTGRKFADLNNNGQFDPGEPGVAGAYIYADLDGDNRPDLFEPFDITGADGTYKLELSGAIGQTFAIREVEEPGFERTIPLSGEYVVTYTGAPLGSNYDFGGLPSRDFGDAPDSYRTTVAANGPSHGISSGLRIGASVDREIDGAPSADATGDDQINTALGQIDDEDGVILTRPLSLTSTGRFEVSLNNTTGSTGYLQVWVDFNGDGDFLDPNEQVRTDLVAGTGTVNIDVPLPAGFNINADGTNDGLLDTFARFRYSLTPGLGVGGPADTGEVEDYAIRILQGGSLANNDSFNVPQNSTAFPLDVLANDFNLPSSPLTIINRTNSAAGGIVTIQPGAPGQQFLRYTPPNNFTGVDSLTYTVQDQAGNIAMATVELIVSFQTASPIAIDDIYEVPSNESNVPLNVLDNDIASVEGGLTIVSVTRGSGNGLLTLTPGNRGLRYTPASGFTGSEQFTYTMQDASGQFSSAIGTVILTPQALVNDKAEFKIQILDLNNDIEKPTLQAGETFRVRVSVDDILRANSTAIQGLQSAFTDLLYTAELVTPVESNPNDSFPFDITFGPKFQTPSFVLGDSLKPGIINEVGAVQSASNLATIGATNDLASHTGFTELFTLTMRATGTGVALFQTDPTEAAQSETVLIQPDGTATSVLSFGEIRYGFATVPIVPAGDNFPGALDDSFPLGVDSNGVAISPNVQATLDVLANDFVGPGDRIIEFGLREAANNGTVTIDNRGTPDPSDDLVNYRPNSNFVGFDEFSYILTIDSNEFGVVRSIANVSLVVEANQNPLAQYDFTFVDEAGNELLPAPGSNIPSVPAGQRFGLRIDAIDLGTGQPFTDAVFAGFLDILYNRNFLETIRVDNGGNTDVFDFDVEFDPQFLIDPAVGVNDRPGLIDEFGSNQGDLGGNGTRLATIYFRGLQPGVTTVSGSPADRFPFQDTLLDQNDNPVPVSQIIYDTESIRITAGAASSEPLQNTSLPADVNADNLVTAIDALLIINEMSRLEAEGEFAANTSGRQYFHDVNGDGLVTAVDALRVINYLNDIDRPSGEPVAPVQSSVTEDRSEPVERDSIEVLAEDAKVVGANTSTAADVVLAAAVSSSVEDNDDDSDDLLDLLAGDIAGL
ncbi:Ig-like domain-containing protein [Neorhodopirellula pilleata]|uniref:GEVED domain-containing protein n=1 Tax=Neorhodopirellula pilleata TaxID=2714738 RepID=A0A5C6ADG9_9BACT|nr:Ig-like domain-containing protein [Neorhodopirellula pilleata]TWT97457.1 hypothetical protein Pla100_26110 [Neorhodopirellula pilleata]